MVSGPTTAASPGLAEPQPANSSAAAADAAAKLTVRLMPEPATAAHSLLSGHSAPACPLPAPGTHVGPPALSHPDAATGARSTTVSTTSRAQLSNASSRIGCPPTTAVEGRGTSIVRTPGLRMLFG